MREIVEEEVALSKIGFGDVDADAIVEAKKMGFSDRQFAHLWHVTEDEARARRKSFGIERVYKTVDTCAAEFEAFTPYHYSTFESECEAVRSDRRKIMIIGGGPNRIGQGIEFDYCCVHASFALKEDGFETIMVNSNPETVSTDYDTSDKLYFEPLTLEHVLAICEKERPDGVIVQFGGQTPLKLAKGLEADGVPPSAPLRFDRYCEDRERFANSLTSSASAAANGIAFDLAGALESHPDRYTMLVRPSYFSRRAMMIGNSEQALFGHTSRCHQEPRKRNRCRGQVPPEDAIEIDGDAIATGPMCHRGIMQHIEMAGRAFGRFACCCHVPSQRRLPRPAAHPYTFSRET